MSARLVIEFVQIFFVNFLVRFERHPAVSPNLETERADSTDHRHHCGEKEPNGHGHVLSRFAIFRAVTKRTRARLLGHKQGRQRQDREKLFHVMMRSRFIFR